MGLFGGKGGLFGLGWGLKNEEDVRWWEYLTPWTDRGKSGQYRGHDKWGGAGKRGQHFNEEMIQKSTEGLSQYLEGVGKGGTPEGEFGFGQALKDAGVEYSFDPTDRESLAKALGKARFEQEMLGEIQQGGGAEGSDIYGEGGYLTPVSGEDYGALQGQGAGRAWKDFWEGKEGEEGRAADFRSMAGMHTLNPYQAAQLDPEHSRWQGMLNPALGEATDVYREDIGNIFGGLGGDIRTGSSLKRRQEAMERYGSNVLGAKEGVQSAQSEYQQRTLQDIINAFQS